MSSQGGIARQRSWHCPGGCQQVTEVVRAGDKITVIRRDPYGRVQTLQGLMCRDPACDCAREDMFLVPGGGQSLSGLVPTLEYMMPGTRFQTCYLCGTPACHGALVEAQHNEYGFVVFCPACADGCEGTSPAHSDEEIYDSLYDPAPSCRCCKQYIPVGEMCCGRKVRCRGECYCPSPCYRSDGLW